MARGGFSQATARRAMALPRDEADTLIKSLERDDFSLARFASEAKV